MKGVFYYSEYSDPKEGRVQFCCGKRDDVIRQTVEHLASHGEDVYHNGHTSWVVRRVEMEGTPGQVMARMLAMFSGVNLATKCRVVVDHQDDRSTANEIREAYTELRRRYSCADQ